MPNNFTVKLYNTDKNMITNILSGHENSIKTIELRKFDQNISDLKF